MKCEQICYLLLETAQNESTGPNVGNLDSFEIEPTTRTQDTITSRLKQILTTLEEEKNEFIAHHQQQQQIHLDKIEKEKDQIIEDLLKSIYNLKKQNEQLRFQYRKRFKVVKNIEDKYENLILNKNKKIQELESVVNYLEGKIKSLEKKLAKQETQMRKENSAKNCMLAKSPDHFLSPNKISTIVSREKLHTDPMRLFVAKDSFEDLTMPMTSSFVSSSKVTASSKTIGRNRSKGKYKQVYVPTIENSRENDAYSSYVGISERKFDDNANESETNFEDNSRITPISLEKRHSVSTSNYLSFEDFNDLDRQDHISGESSVRSSQRASHKLSRDRWNFVREHY